MQFLVTTTAILVGSTLMINGLLVNSDSVINEAKTVVSQANVHQLATAMEMYYLDLPIMLMEEMYMQEVLWMQ